MKRLLLPILLVLFGMATMMAALAWRSPSTYDVSQAVMDFPLMSWDAYRTIAKDVTPPVILENSMPHGAVLIFGAEHRNDPNHPQFTALEEAFEQFSPTIVLVEGRLGFLLPGLMNPTETYGESGHLVQLAKRANLPVYTWELPREQELSSLKLRYNDQQVALYLLLRPFSGAANSEEAERKMTALIKDRGNRPGISGIVTNLDDFDHVWRLHSGVSLNWRTLNGIHNAPGLLGEMFEYGNDIRDIHMLNIVCELTAQGERVMVTAGWSHAVRISQAISGMEQKLP